MLARTTLFSPAFIYSVSEALKFALSYPPSACLHKTARCLLPYLGRQPVNLVLFLTGLHHFCQIFCQLWIHFLRRRKIGLGVILTAHFGIKDTSIHIGLSQLRLELDCRVVVLKRFLEVRRSLFPQGIPQIIVRLCEPWI